MENQRTDSVADQLEKLANLSSSGALSEDEFQRLKAKILASEIEGSSQRNDAGNAVALNNREL